MEESAKQYREGEIPENVKAQSLLAATHGEAQCLAHYRLLAEISPDLLARQNLEGAWHYVSPACRSLLGYEPDEMTGRLWADFVHPDDVPAFAQFQAGMLTGPTDGSRVAAATYRIRRKDGSYIWFETLGRVVTNSETGDAREMHTSSRDVTHWKEAEADREKLLRKLRDEIKNADSLSGVIAICSHCKKIRDDSGRWEQLEAYFQKHSNALFSHGICPECARETFREYTEELGLDL